ncbi:hypothetical protein [Spirosoma agri]|uniref:Uncharacterized protein n=1 Tax=Spirosoma agri TaxID=1987381 RepID=A0A6M0IJ33_9BACT|nr:hypothetical protein [Spirosoma agri]NEU68268.1 hypothetical protein [Spirosoma agri]
MPQEEKQALADQIRQKATELNDLVKTATDAGLTVDLTTPDIYQSLIRGAQPSIKIDIREIQTTKF